MEVQGKVKHVGQTETVGNNGFQKRLIAVETEEQYPQILGVEFVQDKTSLLDAFNTGDTVKIGINLRGREWTNPQGEVKYFNSIQGWRIDKVGAATETAAAPATQNEIDADPLF
jgi:translation initiation factor IF-3